VWKTWTGATQPAAPLSSPQSGTGMAARMGGWHPTLWYMIALVALEWLVALWLLARL
jgi:hypothetical protein